MRFTIRQKELLPAVKAAVGAADLKPTTIPILGNVLIKHEPGALTIIGTDTALEIAALVTMSPSIDEADYGETTVPAAKLLEIIRNLPADAEISFTTKDENSVLIKSGKSRFTLQTLSAEDYPSAMELDDDSTTVVTVPATTLKDAIAQIGYAIPSADARTYLNGMCLDIQSEGLALVGTDGHRLAMTTTTIDFVSDDWQKVILPKTFIVQLAKLLPADGDIKIRVETDRCVQVKLGDLIITSKLIDGRFPDYLGVIPQPTFWMSVEIPQFKRALDQAAILSNEKYKGVRLILSRNKLVVTATNPESEESEVEIEVKYEGEGFEIGFNANYLKDAVTAFDGSSVNIGFTDCNSSILLVQQGNDNYKAIIMPMR